MDAQSPPRVIVRWAPRAHYPWLAERAGIDIKADLCALEVVDSLDGRIMGMVGFDGWSPGSCCMHQAIESAIAIRKLIRAAFEFVFCVAGRMVAIGTVLSTNAKALRLDEHVGFREVFRGRDWASPGVDMVWLEMRKEDCRWIEQGSRKAA